MIGIAVLAGISAVFGATNTLYAAVQARTAEIGTLRAIGFSRGAILTSFLVESLVTAGLGFVVGGICAWGLGVAVSAALGGIGFGAATFTTNVVQLRVGSSDLLAAFGLALCHRPRRRPRARSSRRAAPSDRGTAQGLEHEQHDGQPDGQQRAEQRTRRAGRLRIDRSQPPPSSGGSRLRNAAIAGALLLLVAGGVFARQSLNAPLKVQVVYAQRSEPGSAGASGRRALGIGLHRDGRASYMSIGVRVAGRIEAYLVDESDRVTTGQPLVRLDDRDYKAALARARAELQRAEPTARYARRSSTASACCARRTSSRRPTST